MKRIKIIAFSIYKITNRVNSKIYIGRTKGKIADRLGVHKAHALYGHNYIYNGRKSSGCRYLSNAIRKYGAENFIIELLEICPTFDEMKRREGELIKQHDSCNPLIGYNLRHDTSEGKEFISEDTRKKMCSSTHARAFTISNEVGVDYSNSDGKHSKSPWAAHITYLDESFRKRFSNRDDAIEWYDKFCLYFHGPNCPINKEEKRKEYLSQDLAKLAQETR